MTQIKNSATAQRRVPGYRRRYTTEVNSGRADPPIFAVGDIEVYPNADYPSVVLDVRKRGKLWHRINHNGRVFQCRGCKCNHLILTSSFEQIGNWMEEQRIPLVSLLCVDGLIYIAQPGERYQGKRVVSFLVGIAIDLTGEEEDAG